MKDEHILIIAIVVVVILLCGLGIYLLFRKKSSGNKGGNGGATNSITPTSYGLIDNEANTGPYSLCTIGVMAEMQKEGIETVQAYNAVLSGLENFKNPKTNQNLCAGFCNSTTAHKLNFSDKACVDHIVPKLTGKGNITNCDDLEKIFIEAETGGFCKVLQ